MAESLLAGFLRRLRSFIPVEFKKEVKEVSALALPVVSREFVLESCFSVVELVAVFRKSN